MRWGRIASGASCSGALVRCEATSDFESTAVMLESVAAVFVWSDRNLLMPLPPGQTLPSAERIVLGEIVGAHGLQGEVRVRVAALPGRQLGRAHTASQALATWAHVRTTTVVANRCMHDG